MGKWKPPPGYKEPVLNMRVLLVAMRRLGEGGRNLWFEHGRWTRSRGSSDQQFARRHNAGYDPDNR